MRANVKFLGYAETAQNGYDNVNNYLIDNGSEIEWSDTSCDCGQSECVYFMNTENEECCIIICDACYNNNPSERLY